MLDVLAVTFRSLIITTEKHIRFFRTIIKTNIIFNIGLIYAVITEFRNQTAFAAVTVKRFYIQHASPIIIGNIKAGNVIVIRIV